MNSSFTIFWGKLKKGYSEITSWSRKENKNLRKIENFKNQEAQREKSSRMFVSG